MGGEDLGSINNLSTCQLNAEAEPIIPDYSEDSVSEDDILLGTIWTKDFQGVEFVLMVVLGDIQVI